MASLKNGYSNPIGPGLPSGSRGMGSLPAGAYNGRSTFEQQLAGSDKISITFNARELVRLIDKYTNSFREGGVFYGALREANARAAVKIQKGMYDDLTRQIGTHSAYAGPRPQREGNRLGSAIMDERNALVYPNAFQVGVEAWLNKSPAGLYWRSIEEGMAGYSTRALFITPGGKFASPGDGGPHMRMIQFNTAAQSAAAGKSTGSGRIPGAEISVRPITPFHYSRGGQAAYGRLNMGALYERALNDAGIKITKANRGDYFKPGK